MKHIDLRKKYPEFVYESSAWVIENNNLLISFKFKIGEEFEFNPKITIKNINVERINDIKATVNNLVFNIGLVEMFSYWKAFCSPKIIVNAGYLDDYQINWWKKLLNNGMGQYFYENQIDFRDEKFIEIVSTTHVLTVEPLKVYGNKILVPVGGGKDSSVTLEILKNNFNDVSSFLLNPSKASLETVKIAEVDSVIVLRDLDTQLLNLGSEYLNGHTPFTAVLSFVSLLVSVIGEYKYLIFSNEQSSNEGNTNYLKTEINHQYSKSFEFENDFREYNNKYLSNVDYFSFLRPIFDIQISKILSNYDKYYSVIRSCNVGQKTDTWCGKCPKCLSTFILLFPFSKENTLKIFGGNLIEDKPMQSILNSLIDENTVKPFECVGTRHELRVALGLEKDNDLMQFWSTNNNLPENFKDILQKAI